MVLQLNLDINLQYHVYTLCEYRKALGIVILEAFQREKVKMKGLYRCAVVVDTRAQFGLKRAG